MCMEFRCRKTACQQHPFQPGSCNPCVHHSIFFCATDKVLCKSFILHPGMHQEIDNACWQDTYLSPPNLVGASAIAAPCNSTRVLPNASTQPQLKKKLGHAVATQRFTWAQDSLAFALVWTYLSSFSFHKAGTVQMHVKTWTYIIFPKLLQIGLQLLSTVNLSSKHQDELT